MTLTEHHIQTRTQRHRQAICLAVVLLSRTADLPGVQRPLEDSAKSLTWGESQQVEAALSKMKDHRAGSVLGETARKYSRQH